MPKKNGKRKSTGKRNGNGSKVTFDLSRFEPRFTVRQAIEGFFPNKTEDDVIEPFLTTVVKLHGIKANMDQASGGDAHPIRGFGYTAMPRRLKSINVLLDNRVLPVNFRMATILMPGASSEYSAPDSSTGSDNSRVPKMSRWVVSTPQMSRSGSQMIKVGPEWGAIGQFGVPTETQNPELVTLFVCTENYQGAYRVILDYEYISPPAQDSFKPPAA